MPTGKGGWLDWHGLLKETGLEIISLHADLGSLEREGEAIAREAESFGTDKVVITACTGLIMEAKTRSET